MSNLQQTLAEIKSGAVLLTCEKHQYVAARKSKNGGLVVIPPNPDSQSKGCKDCWRCYYYTDYALTLPNKRLERLDELDEVIHHLVEYQKKGKWDFVPDLNPTIQYHKDAADDVTGEDTRVVITDAEEIKKEAN
jgi:hypothetical protein